MVTVQIFRRALLISALGLGLGLVGCHSNDTTRQDKEIIKAQSEQIQKMIELSAKQADQISQLAAMLEAEKKGSGEARPTPITPAVRQRSEFSITGSAYMMRSNASSFVLRDLRVMLLSNAQVRWSSYVKPAEFYAAPRQPGLNEDRLRADLTQFSGIVNDLVVASATTDADGKYKFPSLPPGDYYIFAQYSGADVTLGWFIPVNIPATGAPLEVNLANSTAYASAYRQAR